MHTSLSLISYELARWCNASSLLTAPMSVLSFSFSTFQKSHYDDSRYYVISFRWLPSYSRGLVYKQLVVCRSTLDQSSCIYSGKRLSNTRFRCRSILVSFSLISVIRLTSSIESRPQITEHTHSAWQMVYRAGYKIYVADNIPAYSRLFRCD